ncbi:uncharacterized protein EI97DRAFT_462697 [Westerdykella ornata]|uniref:Uncharacterized protein n=1 Tax=Westerdykella ornata TaxID=318751 RepID=A0A6A6J7F1_WESOR|nr:uncharacterized protein EI97DRAFT_462697 [Westerdykella ornata]KAF2271576.1 hypothetical protein EI97DRAFT_462697 [Westerdykella ornata]
MSTVDSATRPMAYMSDSEDGQSTGGRKVTKPGPSVGLPPTSNNFNRPAGNIIKGAADENGKLKDAALLLGSSWIWRRRFI